jgi:hypothetical protein
MLLCDLVLSLAFLSFLNVFSELSAFFKEKKPYIHQDYDKAKNDEEPALPISEIDIVSS